MLASAANRTQAALGYEITQVICGSCAAFLADVTTRFLLITGLSYTFQGTWQRIAVKVAVEKLYACVLSRVNMMSFQDSDDLALFLHSNTLPSGERVCLARVNDPGVDVQSMTPLLPGPTRFLPIARLLRVKGLREYVQVARRIRATWPKKNIMRTRSKP